MKKAARILIQITALFACTMLIFFIVRISKDGSMIVHTRNSFRTEKQELNTQGPSGLININTATLEELQELPGIGESTAKAIIRYRRIHGAFEYKKDIKNVNGIGDSVYENIKSMITVKDDP